ncbi:MAG TPA: hypothetical protein VD993_02295 [Chitinophagaceae bacterium]|nr:hypothetical protein [Chitinophagaceae bacterium]
MRTYLLRLCLVLFLGTLAACQKNVDTPAASAEEIGGTAAVVVPPTCGNSLTTTLEDLGGAVSGSVQISNDGLNYYIKITETLADYKIGTVKLLYGDENHVRNSLLGLIQCGFQSPTNPDMTVHYSPGQDEVLITIPIASIPLECFFFHARVTVEKRDPITGALYYAYDLWSNGTANASQNPCQEYFQYCRQQCPPTDCGQLRTQTQGGWGAPPNGNNPGVYLHANFAAAFPTGLTVGCAGGRTVKMTTAQAITNLLPTGGQPAVLTNSYANPGTVKNVLVGQLIALTLSVGFDQHDPNFGQAGVKLGDMVIGSGTFANMTVSQFLTIANNVLGGCSNAYTPSAINEVASKINENYVDGNRDNGFLLCPTQR